MRIVTGDDTGLVKIFDVQRSEILMKMGEQDVGNSINCIEFFNDDNEDCIVSCSKNSIINMYDIDYKEKKSVLQGCIQISEDFNPNVAENNEIVSLYKLKGTDKLIYTFGNNNTQTLKYDAEEENFTDIVDIYKPENQSGIQKSILNESQKKLLLIGKKMNPQMIDIETGKQIWKSRNVSNDWLSLQVPIWDVDARFIQDEKQIYTVTAYQKIRAYDLGKKNCQPTIDHEIDRKKMFEDSPFTSMELSHCKNYMYVSNKLGSIFKLDCRKNFCMVGKMKGSTGSIRQIQMHPTLNYIASVSIDRYSRVYNENQKVVCKQYLNQKLTTLKFSSVEIEDEEENFEEKAKETLQANTNLQSAQKSQDDHRQNKKKFKDLRKHTIKLEYLDKEAYKNKYKKKEEKTSGFVEEENQDIIKIQEQNQKQNDSDSDDNEEEKERLNMDKYLMDDDDDMEEDDIENIAEDMESDDDDDIDGDDEDGGDDSQEYFDKDEDSSSEEEQQQQKQQKNQKVTKKINKQQPQQQQKKQKQGNNQQKQSNNKNNNNNNKNNNNQKNNKNKNKKKGKK